MTSTNAASAEDIIKFSADDFAKITKTTRAVPSPYENVVRSAKPGEGYGVRIREGLQARTIVNNLHKAAKALGVKVQVRVREKATPPVVTFQVVKVAETAKAE